MTRKVSRRPRPAATEITLPHQWTPRPWQQRVLDAFRAGKKRFLIVVHRRAGKDQLGLNIAAIAAHLRRGQYFHVFPTEKANRTAIWLGMDKLDGRRFIDQAFPHELRADTRESTLEIEFTNGSLWKALGSDNYNALRGGNPLGVVFSEYAFSDPMSWTSIMAPILRENGGWAMFVSTPNGRNHFYTLYQLALEHPDVWHVEYLTVNDTTDHLGRPLLSPADIEKAKVEDGLDDSDVQREFYCDWHAVFSGAYYGKDMHAMDVQKRIARVDWDERRPVYAAWDLGHADELVALFMQKNGGAHYCIGSRSWELTKFDDALQDIAVTFPWKVHKHVVPADAASKTLRHLLVEAFEPHGELEVLESSEVKTGIQGVRSILPTLWIDNEKRPWAEAGNNARLIEALRNYRASQTPQQKRLGVRGVTPLHSWESHWADALRYYSVAELSGALTLATWGPAPNYAVHDRIAKVRR